MRTTKRTTNAYSDLENDLRQDIMANRLAGGETIPTEKELMESYGIGRNTVRRALANLVEEGLLRKVHGCGTFVIPPEERTAKTHTRKQSGRQILFLSLSTAMSESSFRGGNTFEPIYAGLNSVFQKAGCNLLLTQIGMDWTPPPCLASRDVGGVIFHGRTDYSFWQKYIRPLPHVGIQYQAPALESDFVALDNYAYSALSVQHLHRLGHRRIGFLSDEIENQLSDERFRGYLQSMKELGLPVEERYCITWQRPFVDGVLAGFAGFHDEGSIGLLEVLPEYRRRGLGEALLCAAVRLALERGQYAFGQVFTDNRPSLALQRKVGMTVSEDILYWLF